jgi:hypothetical protein
MTVVPMSTTNILVCVSVCHCVFRFILMGFVFSHTKFSVICVMLVAAYLLSLLNYCQATAA